VLWEVDGEPYLGSARPGQRDIILDAQEATAPVEPDPYVLEVWVCGMTATEAVSRCERIIEAIARKPPCLIDVVRKKACWAATCDVPVAGRWVAEHQLAPPADLGIG
jgi:hypothetical protein